jgi:hypothetical protein
MMARCKIEEEDQRKWQLERPKSLTKRGSARRPNLRAFRQGKEDEQHKDRSGRAKGQEEKAAEREKNGKDKKKSLLATTSSRNTLENDMLVQLEKLRGRAEEETKPYKREQQQGASWSPTTSALRTTMQQDTSSRTQTHPSRAQYECMMRSKEKKNCKSLFGRLVHLSVWTEWCSCLVFW